MVECFTMEVVEPTQASECTLDTDCPGDEVCVNGFCVDPNGGNGDGGYGTNAILLAIGGLGLAIYLSRGRS